MEIQKGGEWKPVPAASPEHGKHLPSLVVGYTSGDNETQSVPFFISRSGYARDVAAAALDPNKRGQTINFKAAQRCSQSGTPHAYAAVWP
jgi:hypothetical protein